MDNKQSEVRTENEYSLDNIWKEYQNSILSLHPSEEEMNDLINDIEKPQSREGESCREVKDPPKKEAGNMSLEEKLARLEQEKEELRKENEKLKQVHTGNVLPFGMEPEKFLKGENKEALAYLMRIIVPRIRRVINENKPLFHVIYGIGKVSEPLASDTPKTCLTYNRGRNCREGKVHLDSNGNRRIHTCTLCWELLWFHAFHRVVNCPLMTTKFWSDIEAKKAP